jgi:hypothetical protein
MLKDDDVDEPNATDNNLSIKYNWLFNGGDKYNDTAFNDH